MAWFGKGINRQLWGLETGPDHGMARLRALGRQAALRVVGNGYRSLEVPCLSLRSPCT
jgi:hypothetical protein